MGGYAFAGALLTLPSEPALASSPTLHCIVSQEDTLGEWVATRSVTERNGTLEVSRDTYDWEPHEKIGIGPGVTLQWSLNYIWPVSAKGQTAIPPEDVTVELTFRFDPAIIGRALKRPDRSWLHLYRSWSEESGPSVTASSLSDMMLWNQSGDGRLSGRSVLAYDTLMAFSSSRSMLAWSIRSGSEASGTGVGRDWGLFPVATLRGTLEDIKALRKRLDQLASDFRKNCRPAITVSY